MAKKRMSDEDAITHGLTNHRRKERTWKHELDDLIKTHGAEGARQQIGVSPSTMRAWRRGARNPSAANRGKIKDQWNTPQVRKKAIPTRRANKGSATGAKVTMAGKIGPHDSAYVSERFLELDMDPEAFQRIMDEYVWSGPLAAFDEMRAWFAYEYFNDLLPDDVRGQPLGTAMEMLRDEPLAFIEDLTRLDFTLGDGNTRGGGLMGFIEE